MYSLNLIIKFKINLPNFQISTERDVQTSVSELRQLCCDVVCQVTRCLQQFCIIAWHITAKLQLGYSNTKIFCKMFPLKQYYSECNANYSILL